MVKVNVLQEGKTNYCEYIFFIFTIYIYDTFYKHMKSKLNVITKLINLMII